MDPILHTGWGVVSHASVVYWLVYATRRYLLPRLRPA